MTEEYEGLALAVTVPCDCCEGTGYGVVNAYPEPHGCSDCYGKGFSWEPIAYDDKS